MLGIIRALMIATLPERDLSQRRTLNMIPELGIFIVLHPTKAAEF
jgi:hypothetical protein